MATWHAFFSGTGESQSPPGRGKEANKAVLSETELGVERKPQEVEAVAAGSTRVKAS